MNTNMTGFRHFSKILRPCALDECSLSIGRVMCGGVTYDKLGVEKVRKAVWVVGWWWLGGGYGVATLGTLFGHAGGHKECEGG